jgi:F0F1-type ATP synthase membrane subunit b/b'
LAEETARSKQQEATADVTLEAERKLEDATAELARAHREADELVANAARQADALVAAAESRAELLRSEVSPILDDARIQAEKIRHDATAEAEEAVESAQARAQELRAQAIAEHDKVTKEARREAERLRTDSRDEAAAVLQSVRDTVQGALSESSRQKSRQLADELERRLSELGTLDDVVERLRQRRREEDLQALDVTVGQDEDAVENSTEAADAPGVNELTALEDELNALDEIPSEVLWAPTPPPGHESKKRRGLFRKQQ